MTTEQEELRDRIAEGLGKLKTHERELLKLRFGLGCDAYTQDECARIFKVKLHRIQKTEAKAIGKLKRYVPFRPA